MRMPPPTKGISTHETDTWNIARRRSWISDDALDPCPARPRNSVRDISAEGAFEFLRSLLAAALRVFAPSRTRFAGSTRPRPGIFRSHAPTKHAEPGGSGKRPASHFLVGIAPEFFVQRIRSRTRVEARRRSLYRVDRRPYAGGCSVYDRH